MNKEKMTGMAALVLAIGAMTVGYVVAVNTVIFWYPTLKLVQAVGSATFNEANAAHGVSPSPSPRIAQDDKQQ